MLRLGRHADRETVRRAFAGPGPLLIVYDDVLEETDIREAVAGVREAGSPAGALPLLAWLASHANAPIDVLRDLAAQGPPDLLMSLCYNRRLPPDLWDLLLRHPDQQVRVHAHHLFGRLGLTRH